MTRTARLGLISGLLAGYILLAGLLFSLHSEPHVVASDLLPMLVVGAVSIALLFLAPESRLATKPRAERLLARNTSCGNRFGWQATCALFAASIPLGVLISQLFRLLA
jgi:hypothetical protein